SSDHIRRGGLTPKGETDGSGRASSRASATLGPMTLKNALHRALRLLGFDVVRFDGRKFYERKRAELIQALGVDMVIDVGAHAGQYITELRANGFDGRIVAFEPQRGPFEELVRLAARDPKLTARRFALGAEDKEGSMHVSATSCS